MRSAKEVAKEISEFMYKRARLTKKMAEETSTFSSISDEFLEDGDEVDPTLTLSKEEILELSARKRMKQGFMEQLKAELEAKGVRVKIDRDSESMICKSTFYREKPNEFRSLKSLRQSIVNDVEFWGD